MRSRGAVFLKLVQVALAAAVAAGVTMGPPASHAQPDSDTQQGFREAELIIEARPGASIDAINARYGTTTVRRLNGTNFYRLAIPANKSRRKWLKMIAGDPD